jgi:hypothetical protein
VKALFQFSIGTSEEVTVIDKVSTDPVIRVFYEDGLPVVAMLGTDVNQPCQPERRLVADSIEA